MEKKPVIYVLLSAALFGFSAPLAKILVRDISPVTMAGLLYLGAFLGLGLVSLFSRLRKRSPASAPLDRRDLPWLAGAIAAGGIVAPVCLMFGLRMISGFAAALFLNLEGIATAVIAVFFFRENAGKRLWIAIVCMTVAGAFLAWDPTQGGFKLAGPLLVALACTAWGIDNNLTRQIADKNPLQIGMLKGLIAGTVSIAIALILGEAVSLNRSIVFALVLGAFGYGFSLALFIKALRGLGSSRTGAFYSFSPFFGATISILLLKEWLGWIMLPAIALMIAGVYLVFSERHAHCHDHAALTHNHSHTHNDPDHTHKHPQQTPEPHTHLHTHPGLSHDSSHWPDSQHRHSH